MKKITSVLLTAVLIASTLCLCSVSSSAYSNGDFKEYAKGIVKWISSTAGNGGCLFTVKLCKTIEKSSGYEWYAFYMGRLSFEDEPSNYLNAISSYVDRKYREEGTLSEKYATDYHRIALAVKSAGGDPFNVGGHNLIADGVYNRNKTASLGKQGLNGWLWGLIALDGTAAVIPDGSGYTRDEIINEILKYQTKDGGFSLLPTAKSSDVDTTAMALYALAPYRSSDKEYTYNPNYSKRKTVTKKIGQIINEGVERLAQAQLDEGGYSSFGTVNSESVSQAIIALCTLGIDPESDVRFIRNNKRLVDILLSFRCGDGGFEHNHGGGSDPMAGEQALGAMAALDRFYNGMTNVFDMKDGAVLKAVVKENGSASNVTSSENNASQNASSRGEGSASTVSGSSSPTNTSSSSFATQATEKPEKALSSASSETEKKEKATSAKAEKKNSGSSDKKTKREQTKAVKASSSKTESSADTNTVYAANEKNKQPSAASADAVKESAGINPTAFVILGLILIVAFVGYYFYKRKKGLISQNPEDDFFAMLKQDMENAADNDSAEAIEPDENKLKLEEDIK